MKKTSKSKQPAPVRVQPVVGLHPAAKIFNEWLNSEEGKACTEGVTIGAELHGHYMENRCRRAFNAGWRGAVQSNAEVSDGGPLTHEPTETRTRRSLH